MVDRNVCVRRSKSGSSFFVLVPWPRRLITLGRSEGSVFSVHLHLHYLLVSYHYLTICYFLVCALQSCLRLVVFFPFVVVLSLVICSILHYLCMVYHFLSLWCPLLLSIVTSRSLNRHPRCFLFLSFCTFSLACVALVSD
jgi:hypothetical protein